MADDEQAEGRGGGRLPPLAAEDAGEKKKRRRRRPREQGAENTGFQEDGEVPGERRRRRRRGDEAELPTPAEDDAASAPAPAPAPEGEGEGEGEAKKERKRRPKRRPQPEGQEEEPPAANEAPVGLAEDLADLEEDVKPLKMEREEGEEAAEEDVDGGLGGGLVIRSEPAQNYYIESKRGNFRSEKKGHWEARVAAEREKAAAAAGQVEEDTGNATLKFALSVNKCFRSFTLFVICLFSGISLWNTVVVNAVYGQSPWNEFYDGVAFIARPVAVVWQICLILCVVSVLDRYDWGRVNRRFCRDCSTCKTGAFCVFFFVIALVAHYSIYTVDRVIFQFGTNSTYKAELLNNSVAAATQPAKMQLWIVGDIVRSVATVLGTFVVLMTPTYDALAVNLQTETEEEMLDEDSRELLDMRA